MDFCKLCVQAISKMLAYRCCIQTATLRSSIDSGTASPSFKRWVVYQLRPVGINIGPTINCALRLHDRKTSHFPWGGIWDINGHNYGHNCVARMEFLRCQPRSFPKFEKKRAGYHSRFPTSFYLSPRLDRDGTDLVIRKPPKLLVSLLIFCIHGSFSSPLSLPIAE